MTVKTVPGSLPRLLKKADLNKQHAHAQFNGSDWENWHITHDGGKTIMKNVKTGEKIEYTVEMQDQVLKQSAGGKLTWVVVSPDELKAHIAAGDAYKQVAKPEEAGSVEDANIVTSLLPNGKHAPVLDFDFSHTFEDGWLTVEDDSAATVFEYLNDIDLPTTYAGLDASFDFPHVYVPSSTLGHGHLYIDVEFEDNDFWEFLAFLRDAGWIENGYYQASRTRGYTAVRLPWIKKEINV